VEQGETTRVPLIADADRAEEPGSQHEAGGVHPEIVHSYCDALLRLGRGVCGAMANPGAQRGENESRHGGVAPECEPPLRNLVLGSSRAMAHVMEQVRLVAVRDTTVLITGETGTGKEEIAQAVRALGPRHRAPMVSVNCGGIPATLLEDEFFGHVRGAFTDARSTRIGRFEQAHTGTIFLDEIADLPLELQPKLLRVLQERVIHRIGGLQAIHLDVRVIAATNVSLWKRVEEGRFREDLYYRLNVFPVHLPPLRERREDVPLLIDHFLAKLCRRERVPPKRVNGAALAALQQRSWAGNIRELQNAVEFAFIRSQERQELTLDDFPAPPPSCAEAAADLGRGDFHALVARYEAELLRGALAKTRGNRNQAAKLLGMKLTTLVEKMKRLGPLLS